MNNIPKRRRVLVKIITDGSAKTFVYKDLDEQAPRSSLTELKSWLLRLIGKLTKT